MPGTTVGPVEAIEDSDEFRTVLVQGHWVNIWSRRYGKIIHGTVSHEVVQGWIDRGWRSGEPEPTAPQTALTDLAPQTDLTDLDALDN